MKKPIYSALQYPHYLDDGGPIVFGGELTGPLANIHSELEWRLFDFCRIHQIVYKEILTIDCKLSEIPEEIVKIPSNVDIDSMEDLVKLRIREAVYAQDMENARVTSFVDHMIVVGLWAIAEQFMGKTYRGYIGIRDSVPSEQVQSPYRWDDFRQRFNAIGIDLGKLENFDNANECRAVNNAIKHDPIVGARLTSFQYFSNFTGKKLDVVPLEMQRYFNGVSDFLGSLIEKCDELLPPNL